MLNDRNNYKFLLTFTILLEDSCELGEDSIFLFLDSGELVGNGCFFSVTDDIDYKSLKISSTHSKKKS